MTPKRRARLAVSIVCEPGDPRLPALLAAHGPMGLIDAIRADRQLEGRPWPSAWIHRVQSLDQRLARAERLAEVAGLRWVVQGDRGWPTGLDDLDHVEPLHGATGAPVGLWVRGTGHLADLCATSVAVVGARDCTPYGAEAASEIAADAAAADVTVVSGAAFGIDASAHRGALAMGRPTVAVLACDAATDYPRAHAALLSRIAESGLVVSEQPPGHVPTKPRFLSRNRLIAGLAGGTVVVEARRRSGSLNTLHWADRLGRPTMAVPGPVTSQQSGGTHQAVRDGKAVLVTGGSDVLAELAGLGAPEPESITSTATEFDQLPAPAQRALDALSWRGARSARDVAAAANLGPHNVAKALELLARRGLAERAGDGWLLVRRADLA
ncbi:DNA-processing protein DprA [Aeromicrobium sp.]|uniref:DNA-processing protein DprA n=1 Tax=Aeromicrobium sp. TaxID=1871063 RepID=UPI003D6B2ABD